MNHFSPMVSIRTFRNQDSAAVGELISKIQVDEFNIPITLQQQPDLADISAFYQHGSGNFWVTEYESKIIGTIALLNLSNNEVALRKMFVEQEFRGPVFGTARLLLKLHFHGPKRNT